LLSSHLYITRLEISSSGCLQVLALADSRSLNAASAACSNLARLLTRHAHSVDSTGLAHVLLVSTTVRVINGVHRNTTHDRPRISLHSVLVESAASLEHGLVSTSTAGNEADHGAALVADSLLRAGGKANTGDTLVGVLRHDDGVGTGGTGHLSAVTGELLDVADGGTLRQVANRDDVTDCKSGLDAVVYELTSVHALRSGDQNVLLLEAVGILELDLGDRSTTARIVDDVLDNTLGITLTLGEVQLVVGHSSLAKVGVRTKHGSLSLSLRSDNFSHCDYMRRAGGLTSGGSVSIGLLKHRTALIANLSMSLSRNATIAGMAAQFQCRCNA